MFTALVVIVHLLDIIVVNDDSLFFKDSGVGGVAISASVVSSMPKLPTLLSLLLLPLLLLLFKLLLL